MWALVIFFISDLALPRCLHREHRDRPIPIVSRSVPLSLSLFYRHVLLHTAVLNLNLGSHTGTSKHLLPFFLSCLLSDSCCHSWTHKTRSLEVCLFRATVAAQHCDCVEVDCSLCSYKGLILGLYTKENLLVNPINILGMQHTVFHFC